MTIVNFGYFGADVVENDGYIIVLRSLGLVEEVDKVRTLGLSSPTHHLVAESEASPTTTANIEFILLLTPSHNLKYSRFY
jgi:hypothetical protein